jgi:hypothetical protein
MVLLTFSFGTDKHIQVAGRNKTALFKTSSEQNAQRSGIMYQLEMLKVICCLVQGWSLEVSAEFEVFRK